ncbi:hypothetical protein SDJN02_03410, partial [Cucurbita argyrosperma subsp. argyrosperma]
MPISKPVSRSDPSEFGRFRRRNRLRRRCRHCWRVEISGRIRRFGVCEECSKPHRPNSPTGRQSIIIPSKLNSTLVELHTIPAKNSTAPAASMQRLLDSLAAAIDRSRRRQFCCENGDNLASARIRTTCLQSTGGLGVGILSMPLQALTVHQA